MSERRKSHDGRKETEDIFGTPASIGQKGREGGRLAREIGTRDEEKRATERPAGVTRVTKKHEDDDA